VVVQTSLGSHEMSQTAGEHKGRKSKFELDIPLQEHNHFINCFMERPHGVHRYHPTEPEIM